MDESSGSDFVVQAYEHLAKSVLKAITNVERRHIKGGVNGENLFTALRKEGINSPEAIVEELCNEGRIVKNTKGKYRANTNYGKIAKKPESEDIQINEWINGSMIDIEQIENTSMDKSTFDAFDVTHDVHYENAKNAQSDFQSEKNVYLLLIERLKSEIEFLRSSMESKDSIIADLVASLSNAKTHVCENLTVPDNINDAPKHHDKLKDVYNKIPFDYSTPFDYNTPTKSPGYASNANDWDAFTAPKPKQRAKLNTKRGGDDQPQIPITKNRYDVLSKANSPTRITPTNQNTKMNTKTNTKGPADQRTNHTVRSNRRNDLSEAGSPNRVPLTFWNNKVPGKGNFDKLEIRNGKFEIKDEKKVTIYSDSMGTGLGGNYLTSKANNNCRVKVRAFNGATSEHLRKYHMLATLNDDPPDTAYIHIGTNDLRTPRGAAPTTVEDIAEGIIKCANTCRSYGVKNILVSSICDRRGKYLSNRLREVNELVQEKCKYNGYTFVSNDEILFDKHLKDDGLHFNNDGKNIFSRIFLKEIRNLHG